MDKSNLELFKQALSEGVSKKFDSVVNSFPDEIVYSEKHKIAMRTIVYGKTDIKRTLSPKMKRIIAILVAAALLLTSCGIIFRNEIREIFDEFFVKLSYDGDDESNNLIEEVYYLNYVPEGYILEKEHISATYIQYKFSNQENFFYFEQRVIAGSNYYIDIKHGYSQINEIKNYDIYYRLAEDCHWFVFYNEKYSMLLRSNTKLSDDDIVKIIEGITTK